MYDAFNVWRTWGVDNPLPAIDNETFTQVGAPGPSTPGTWCSLTGRVLSVLMLLAAAVCAGCCLVRQVTELAMWLETSKMDPGLTGSLLGGGLLGDVLHRMAAAEAAYQANSQVSSLPVCAVLPFCLCVSLPQQTGLAPHSCTSCRSLQQLQAGSLHLDGFLHSLP